MHLYHKQYEFFHHHMEYSLCLHYSQAGITGLDLLSESPQSHLLK